VLQVVYDRRFRDHHTGAGHPERPARLAALIEGLEAGGCAAESFKAPREARLDEITAVHSERYVELVRRFCDALDEGVCADLPTGDTVVCRESFPIALLAAGAAIEAVECAYAGSVGFACVRPPGHHAEPEAGMGFCVFNNIAIAARFARAARGATLIADFDYHHGNGTQTWVERAMEEHGPPIGFVSTHASPAYPGTGAFSESRVTANGFIVDVPLAHSTETNDFVSVWRKMLPPLVRRIAPKTILVSAGFDFLAGDPIAGLPVSQRAVGALCELLQALANESGAALAFALEGGYALENLRNSGATLADVFRRRGAAGVESQRETIADARLRAVVEKIGSWL
jgi:acetoin utilization deacetylase AcuC-like enzyme